MDAPLILGSASPRRRELLARVGVCLEVEPASVDEAVVPGEHPLVYARRVAAAKADVLAARRAQRWILTADTVVDVDGDILGKAADDAGARAMLARLSGRSHRVTTAFCVVTPDGARHHDAVTTEVTMRALSPAEIGSYVASGEWRGKAGAYAVQGIAAAFVTQVRGSITNVIGLPLSQVVVTFAKLGGPAPSFADGVPA